MRASGGPFGGSTMGGGMGLFGGAMGLLWMGLLVLVPLAILYGLASRSRPASADPLALLRERFARGELTADEFDRRRERLERDR